MSYFEINGIKLFYEEEGKGIPPLLFVHGISCTHEDWKYQADYFSSRFRVITTDLRGHGLSDPDPQHTDIKSFASDILSLLGTLGYEQAVLIGHSMGCRVVLQAYTEAPEKVAGIVLVDGGRAHGKGKPGEAKNSMRNRINHLGYSEMIQSFYDNMFFEGSDPSLKEYIVKRALNFPEDTGVRTFETTVVWDACCLDEAISGLNVPVLVLQSTGVTPERVRVMLKPGDNTPWIELIMTHVPSARIEIISGVGHFTMLEAPERVNRLISDFLTGLQV